MNLTQQANLFTQKNINRLSNKRIYKTKYLNHRRILIAVAVCSIFIIYSVSATADIREIFSNIFVTEQEDSLHISQHDMYMNFDLDEIPKSWDYIYLPEYIPAGYYLNSVKSDDTSIEIIFCNENDKKILYTITKGEFEISKNDEYEIINADSTEIYYKESKTKEIIQNLPDCFIEIVSENVEKNELLQIIKNIKILGR